MFDIGSILQVVSSLHMHCDALVSMQAPGQTLSHHRQQPSGSRLQHSHGISVHPVSGLGEHRADSPTVPTGEGRENKDARNRNGGSDSGSNSPDRVPEGNE